MEQKRYNQRTREVNIQCKFWGKKRKSQMSQNGCFWSLSHTTRLPNEVAKCKFWKN